jgi:predicted ABC-type ATPase
MTAPRLVVIAGPNGSGKTTLTAYLRSRGIDFGFYINPDDIAAELDGDYDNRVRRAQAIADERREHSLAEGRDFSFETVFSHPSKLDVLQKARARGFEVTLFFVATEDPRINLERVRSRVAQGGHDVPDDKVVARYGRSLTLLRDAILLSDRSLLFDNSGSVEVTTSGIVVGTSGLQLVAEFKRPEGPRSSPATLSNWSSTWHCSPPRWCRDLHPW